LVAFRAVIHDKMTPAAALKAAGLGGPEKK
jgi:hypothetical protein